MPSSQDIYVTKDKSYYRDFSALLGLWKFEETEDYLIRNLQKKDIRKL